MNPLRRPLLNVEHLETRLTPAIDFTNSTFAFGTLNLVTDGTATTVTLSLTNNNEVLVDDGVTPTTFTGVTSKLIYNGSEAGDVVTFDLNGFNLTAGVWLNGGTLDDTFTIQDTAGTGQLNGVLNINASEGTNTIEIDQLKSLSSVNITAAFGDDTVNVDTMNIKGVFWADLGDGTNTLTVAGTDVVTVGNNFKVSTGLGDDVMSLGDTANLTIGGSLMIAAGDGLNTVDIGLNGGATKVAGAFTYTGGIGDDDLSINEATFGGGVSIGASDGVNTVDVAVTEFVKIGGGFHFTGGNDTDTVNLGTGQDMSIGGSVVINTLDSPAGDVVTFALVGNEITVGGSIVITMGLADGNNTVSLQDTQVKGSVSINSLGGVDVNVGTENPVVVGGSLLIKANEGSDNIAFGGVAGTKINGSVTINAGNGANTWNMGNDFFVRGNMTLTSGLGDDDLTLFATVTGGQVQGNLTVNLGHGANTFTLNGSVGTATTGGMFTYNGGNDVDTVTVNGRVFRSLNARLQGGDDVFTYGVGSFVGNPFINRRGTAYLDGGLGNNTFTNNGPAFLTTVTRRTRIVIA